MHGNTDGLSRRLCEARCKQWSHLEEKQKISDYMLRTICETTCAEDWRRAQKEHEEIGFLLQKKIEGVKLTW